MEEIKKFSTLIEIPITYMNSNTGQDKPLLIFFHGFADSASAFLRRAYPQPSDRYEILAINGPFPVPQKKDGLWKHAFGWYFSDFLTNTTFIHPKVAVKAVNDLLAHLNLNERKKMLIGFSQGGFFIPHLLPTQKNVEHVVSIGAAYRAEDYPETLNVSIDALHGTNDDIIPLASAAASFLSLKAKNPKGEFREFKEMGHTMNSEARAWLSNKIDEVFK